MTRSGNKKRPYLPRKLRRNSLLSAAAKIAENRGWGALTMVSLARQANVSRQLVYQHFDSVDQLMVATLTYIFQDVYERTRDEVRRVQPDGIVQTVIAMQQITLDIPVGRARALWQAMTAAGSGSREIAEVSRHLRHLLVKTTQPLLEIGLGITPRQAGPLAWMLLMAFWGARQLTDDGELTRDDAMQLFSWLFSRVVRGGTVEPPLLMGNVQDN